MESLYLLIPLSVLAVFVIVLLLWWATSRGQFDDLAGPAHQILMDDDLPPIPPARAFDDADTRISGATAESFDTHQRPKPADP